MSPVVVHRLRIRGEQDVFFLRQRGREVARAVGLDAQDQIRVAAALSDLGRLVVAGDVAVTVVFQIGREPRPEFRVDLGWQGGVPVPVGQPGWHTADRLMDQVRSEDNDGTRGISLVKRLAADARPMGDEYLTGLRSELARLTRGSPLDELRVQNDELLVTLDSLERKQDELIRLNEELEETNRGVVALYAELTAELEQTNRGVVALYGELEDRSQQLKAANEAKARFWSNVSHELRTPVNSVIGLTRLLLGPGAPPLDPEQRRQVQMINDSGGTMLSLVHELLDIAKAESGKLEAHPGETDLLDLFGQLRGTLAPLVPSDAVTLVVEDPPEPAVLVTDETLLSRVLRNLLSNGLKFTEAGEVRLSSRHRDGEWEFLVTDTGIGIPPHEQERVFEEFHQVPNPLQARSRGTGLGLPYARRLTEILGGVLRLSSTPGEGTQVLVRMSTGPGTHNGGS